MSIVDTVLSRKDLLIVGTVVLIAAIVLIADLIYFAITEPRRRRRIRELRAGQKDLESSSVLSD